jgi:hypothetical protein
MRLSVEYRVAIGRHSKMPQSSCSTKRLRRSISHPKQAIQKALALRGQSPLPRTLGRGAGARARSAGFP